MDFFTETKHPIHPIHRKTAQYAEAVPGNSANAFFNLVKDFSSRRESRAESPEPEQATFYGN